MWFCQAAGLCLLAQGLWPVSNDGQQLSARVHTQWCDSQCDSHLCACRRDEQEALRHNLALAVARPPGKAPSLTMTGLPWLLLGAPVARLGRAYAGLWSILPAAKPRDRASGPAPPASPAARSQSAAACSACSACGARAGALCLCDAGEDALGVQRGQDVPGTRHAGGLRSGGGAGACERWILAEQARVCCAKSVTMLRSRMRVLEPYLASTPRAGVVPRSADAGCVEAGRRTGAAAEGQQHGLAEEMVTLSVRVLGRGRCERGAALCGGDSGVIVGFVTSACGAGPTFPGGIGCVCTTLLAQCSGKLLLRNPTAPEKAVQLQWTTTGVC